MKDLTSIRKKVADHRLYGGLITFSDFNTSYNDTDSSQRIISAFKFDATCKANSLARSKRKAGKA